MCSETKLVPSSSLLGLAAWFWMVALAVGPGCVKPGGSTGSAGTTGSAGVTGSGGVTGVAGNASPGTAPATRP